MWPNPLLNSDPTCIAFRFLSTSRFLGSARRLGAGGADWLHSLNVLGNHCLFIGVHRWPAFPLLAPNKPQVCDP